MKVILATGNSSKLEEIKCIFNGSRIEIVGMKEVGAVGEANEDGLTLLDNACKKADFIQKQFHKYWIMADDSGLFVKALGNSPGVHSARWAGEGVSTREITSLFLQKMARVPVGQRQAYFETVAVLFSPNGGYWIFSGKVRGKISLQSRGKIREGMPYDPVFVPDGHDTTFSEMSLEIKNSLSHRSRAFRQVKEFLQNCQETGFAPG